VLFILAVVGLLSFIVLDPGLYPTASVKMRIPQREIIEVVKRPSTMT